MHFLRFLQRESGAFRYVFILLGLISGVANAVILQFIDTVITHLGEVQGEFQVDWVYMSWFAGVLVVLMVSQRIFSSYLIRLTQKVVCRIRLDIMQKVRFAPYYQYEQMGREKVYASLTQDASVISVTASSLVYAATSLVTILFCLGYLAYKSMLGFGVTVLVIFLGVLIYQLRQKSIEKDLAEARGLQNLFFKYIDELLLGFKEAKVNHAKNEDLYRNYIEDTTIRTRDLNTKSIIRYLDNNMVSQLFLYILIGFILFYFPKLTGNSETVVSYIFIILYVIGPIRGLMSVIPELTQANISIGHINDLYARVESMEGKEVPKEETAPAPFQTLAFDGVTFSYDSEFEDDRFSIGPIDMQVNRGELVFIAGGNGSGKTTLFKLLTGLYYPANGAIKVDGEPVQDLVTYRNLFSPIFSDFHLFEQFYGMDKVDPQKVKGYIELMEIQHKVQFEGNRFSTTELSTGQRKRLALIMSLVEDRPILVLDEWAADQDPQFRKFFYETFLLDLKAQGKTIIAITHDDRYYEVADKLYRMEYGKMRLS